MGFKRATRSRKPTQRRQMKSKINYTERDDLSNIPKLPKYEALAKSLCVSRESLYQMQAKGGRSAKKILLMRLGILKLNELNQTKGANNE